MKIGIISDTHLSTPISRMHDFLQDHLGEVNIVIHAGDYKDIKILEELQKLPHFVGVWGNVDTPEIQSLLPERKIIEVEGYGIGIFHGHGTKGSTLQRAYDAFKYDPVDIIVFGHSHQPVILTKNKRLMLNPGSPFSKRKEANFSYIILELKKDGFDVSLRFFSQ